MRKETTSSAGFQDVKSALYSAVGLMEVSVCGGADVYFSLFVLWVLMSCEVDPERG